MTPLCSRPKGSSLVDHRGFVQCFQLGGWLEEVPPRQNQCILRELAQDWQAVTCLKEITHSEQVATCSFHWLGDSTKTWNDETFHGLGNHQGIAAGKLRRRRLEDILQRVMTGDGGNFKFWSMWDVSMLWLPFAWQLNRYCDVVEILLVHHCLPAPQNLRRQETAICFKDDWCTNLGDEWLKLKIQGSHLNQLMSAELGECA